MTTFASVGVPDTGVPERYDTPTLVFHWLTAILVLALFGSALTWNYATPRDHFWRPLLESTHVSLGILFGVLIVVRLVWRFVGTRRLPGERGVPGLLSRAMYGALYTLLAAQVVSGFALRWTQGEEFSFFGLFTVPALLAQNRSVAHLIEDIHNYAAWTIVILSLGHALAALVHHYLLKDAVLDRMLLRRSAA